MNLPPTTSAPKEASRGFTLIEMLTVVTVIAVVAALAFPLISSAMLKAKQAQCAAQLRGVYQVLLAYATDHDQYYPPTYGGLVDPEATWWWYQEESPLAAYAGGGESWTQLTICPLNRTAEVVPSKSHVKGYPYVVNYNVMATTGKSYQLRRMVGVRQPPNIVLMSDSVTGGGWGWGFDNTDPEKKSGGWARLNNSHQGQANLLWCDGHVTHQALETLVPENSMNISLKD